MAGKRQNMAPMWKNRWKRGSWWTHSTSWSRVSGMYSTWTQTEWNHYWDTHVWITYFCWSNWKITRGRKTSRPDRRVVLRHGRTCSKFCWEMLRTGERQKQSSCVKFRVLAWMITNSKRESLNQLENFYRNAHKLFWHVCTWHEFGRRDILWSVNKLARSVTKWTRACDKRLSRLISYIHHTNDHRPYCHVGNTAQHCRLGLFQDSDFAGSTLRNKKSNSVRILCIFGSRTFVTLN